MTNESNTCSVAGRNAAENAGDACQLQQPGQAQAAPEQTYAAAETAECANKAANTVILDVRTPEEFAEGHLEGAINIDYNGGEVEAKAPELDPDAQYFVYCKAGGRAERTIALLNEAGITSAQNLHSLQEAAETTGLPIVQ
ncbi:MAG: rhodanese-like domain-containing protein [Microbacteriaceae bacterium]|nr:rhodanese-like domain-containing protein [Microbacteriaceae bacterium]